MANSVEIKVDVDVQGAAQVQSLAGTLNTTATSADRLGNAGADSATGLNKANEASKGFTTTSTKLRDGMESVSTQLARAKTELLAFVGVGAGIQGVKDITALTDSYKNLEARIKLVTGEGKAFDEAFEGVLDVAKRTYTSLEETGTLFAKIADAGKELGVSQAEALKLTETINQATQLGSQSAESSAAAIQQLIQALQSGVLRGDEFNSIMEQAPRLQTALSDALGVTGGELRKMAEAGQLSSATVIKALQSQSEVIQGEFNKLPATVGRAMTNLSTEFTRYIGEADKAGGYSAKLAGIIDSLAGNLSTVATVMIKVGQSVAALKLLSMAQDWLSAGAAIRATTVATEQHTISTAKNTAAKGQNTAAVAANSQAQIANAGSIKAAGAAAETSSKSLGIMGGALRMIGGLAVLDIALNFRQYGTAIGEFAARMMGAKDRTQELADAEKRATAQAEEAAAMRKRQAVALEEARDKTYELSKQAKNLTAKFDELRGKGDSAADAIRSIGKDFDLSNVEGVKNAGAVLDTLKDKGKITADQFANAWSDALKGVDLATFEVQARAAFSGTQREAERMAQVLDVTAREAIKRTGLDFELISGGMGKASRMAINDTQAIIDGLDRLKGAGVDVGQALTASLSKGIKEAQTDKALAEVRQQIEQVKSTLGQKVVDGLLDQAKKRADELKVALENARPGIDSVAEAMRKLGITSDASLKETAASAKEAYEVMRSSGTASARELQEGFKKYAEAAIAANNGVASDTIKVEASMRGLAVQSDNTGKSIVTAMKQGSGAAQQLTNSVESATDALERQAAAAEKAAAAERKRRGVDEAGFSADKNGNRIVMGNELGSLTGIYNFLKSAGVDNEAVARQLAKEFTDGKDMTPYAIGHTAGYKKYAPNQYASLSAAVLAAAQKYTFGSEQQKTQMRLEAQDTTLKAEQEKLKKIPKFASGGTHKGGIRLVGENGPELEVTGPSRIIDTNKTRSLIKDAEANEQILLKAIADIEKRKKELEGKAKVKAYDATEWRKKSFARGLTEREYLSYQASAKKAETDAQQLRQEAFEETQLLNEYKGRLMANAKAKREQELLLLSAPPPAPPQSDRQRAEAAARVERERIDAHVKAIGAKQATQTPVTSNTLSQSPTTAQNANTSSGKTYTVHINLNGKTTTVNTSTDDDAQRLIDVLRSAKMAAGG